ncbi:MAG: flagellar assembly peptidoglycan hydrolase FlgJ [Shewanella sp. CG18_big_fil_WC_8_21_14_2_50_42_11]|nr:MAG: flagellar assembly peptidoglycan hydrolase FlgJ [Shewanella sp. CG18_big_fil_WC_8_21_14_2_50_42_11]PIX71384.1 MAG: flagellar assembly peptidoglycan hydrolase FlgJ [Shewanella sp. CG_4_10_14_3_um_filter_42_91]PIY67150.1 MAG: flagellar assembly peptidoglycan hydrolase FlgJ [Shewanella sp. CG_4_10_14_0_8_um_filter_42_13]PJB89828.1 MAG: flagellar assembly peptidoglycan hydrolase FlgJ [Shewanella sp. CG_4_9_14_0_8_um_filter_42_14]
MTMEKLSASSNFLDLGGLDSLRVQAQKDEKGALKEAAKQFEGIFIQMLMKSMRDANAAFKSDNPMNSETTAFFEQMRDQQMSVDLSNKGMLGLAEMMVQQLDPENSPITPASVLRGNSDYKVNPSMFVAPATELDKDTLDAIAPKDQIAASHSVIDHAQSMQPMTAKLSRVLSGEQLDSVLRGEQLTSQALQMGKSLPQVDTPMAKSKGIAVSQFTSPEHFISVLYPHAEKAAKSLGTSAEVLIAQSALETGWGQKVVRRNDGTMSNNLFNIKADKRWQGDKTSVNTLEFEKGIAVQQKADFRMYDNLEQSFNDFVSFISQGDRYQDARKVAAEPTQFIKALQKAGYATDPQYANKVINVMKSVKEGLKSVLPVETK